MILVITPKQGFVAKRLVEEARNTKQELKIMDIADLVLCNFKLDIKRYSSLYVRNPYLNSSPKYLLQIVKLAKEFKKAGKKVVDANISKGEIGKGKFEDYKKLRKAGLLIPETEIYNNKSLIVNSKFYILKWIYGLKGKSTYLIKKRLQLTSLLKKYKPEELLLQEFIPSEYEYKVITTGFKALPIVLRFKPNSSGFKINLASYEVLDKKNVREVVRLAEKASKILGRELSKVDILERNGKFYVLEVNRFPGVYSFEKLTKFNVLQQFLKYLSSTN